MTPEEAAAHVRSLDDMNLAIIANTKVPTSLEAIAAKLKAGRRDRNRSFWRKDIVAWIALALSIISLALHYKRWI